MSVFNEYVWTFSIWYKNFENLNCKRIWIVVKQLGLHAQVCWRMKKQFSLSFFLCIVGLPWSKLITSPRDSIIIDHNPFSAQQSGLTVMIVHQTRVRFPDRKKNFGWFSLPLSLSLSPSSWPNRKRNVSKLLSFLYRFIMHSICCNSKFVWLLALLYCNPAYFLLTKMESLIHSGSPLTLGCTSLVPNVLLLALFPVITLVRLPINPLFSMRALIFPPCQQIRGYPSWISHSH